MWDLVVSVPDHCLSFYFEIKFTISVAGVYLFLTIVKGNSCLFETCV